MPTSERIEGPTPSGAAYAVAYWRDEDGDPCEKGEAKQAEIVEFDGEDKPIRRTYGYIGGYKPPEE